MTMTAPVVSRVPPWWTRFVDVTLEIGIGSGAAPDVRALWDRARWDDPASGTWSGLEPAWVPVDPCRILSFKTTRGRERWIDRFPASSCSIVVDDPYGELSWDQDVDDDVLEVRPGRQVRLRARHVASGEVFAVWRGWLETISDAFAPGYPPPANLTNQDLLAQVAHVNLPERDPVGAGETSGARIARILALADVDPAWQDLDVGRITVQATNLARNLADELGVTADSEGGAVFVDRSGIVCFRDADWLRTAPYATTVQAKIGGAANPNLVPNSGFEDGFSSWSTAAPPFADWTIDTLSWAPDAAASARMACLDPSFSGNPGHYGNAMQTIVDVGYEGAWTGSAWFKAPAGRSIGVGMIPYYEIDGQTVAPWTPGGLYPDDARATVYFHVLASGEWERVVATLPPDRSSARSYGVDFRVGIGGSNAGWVAGDVMNVDSTQLEHGTRATEYAPANGPILCGAAYELKRDAGDIVNDVQVARAGGTMQRLTDETSIARYRRRTWSRGDYIMESDEDALRLGSRVLTARASGQVRMDEVRITPIDDEETWKFCLAVDYGWRVEVLYENPWDPSVAWSREVLVQGVDVDATPDGWTFVLKVDDPYRLTPVDTWDGVNGWDVAQWSERV